MKKINLKGLSCESVTGILLLLLSLVNSVLQIFGLNTLPVLNDEISSAVSSIFLVITALYNTWKNRNISTAAQIAQQVTDAVKNGEIAVSDIRQAIAECKLQRREEENGALNNDKF